MLSAFCILDPKKKCALIYKEFCKTAVSKKTIISDPQIWNDNCPPIVLLTPKCTIVRFIPPSGEQGEETCYFIGIVGDSGNVVASLQYLTSLTRTLQKAIGCLSPDAIVLSAFRVQNLITGMVNAGLPMGAEDYAFGPITSVTEDEETLEKEKAVVPWRPAGVVHRKNVICVEVTENINATMSRDGTIQLAEVVGQVHVDARLSGLPQCCFRSSFDGSLENVLYHQSVQRNDQNVMVFIPPDKQFLFLTYRLETCKVPLALEHIFEPQGRLVNFKVVIKATIPKDKTVTQLLCRIPMPQNAVRLVSINQRKAKFKPNELMMEWNLRRLVGGGVACLKGTLEMIDSAAGPLDFAATCTTLDFSIPNWTPSGFAIQEMSTEKTKTWLKYRTKAGDYRMKM